jgi:hypothetical protein
MMIQALSNQHGKDGREHSSAWICTWKPEIVTIGKK